MNRIWCNGQWLSEENFNISAADRGLLHGLGLFETILAVNGTPVRLDRHLHRMRDACNRLGWNHDFPSTLGRIMGELLDANQLTSGHAKIRLSLSAGSGPLNDPTPGPDHLLWMDAKPVADAQAEVAVGRSPWLRNEHSPLAGLKCFSYAENLLALAEARQRGFSETLFFNHKNHLCEAATANVFWVRNHQILTPPLSSGCLAGITRQWVIETASQLGISCAERDAQPDEVATADEMFLTSSIRGIMSVSRFESTRFPPARIAPSLRDAWGSLI